MDFNILLSHDFLRFYLVFIHILTSTTVVGSIIYAYISFLKFGYFGKKRVHLEHEIVFYSLLVLITSGLGIIYLDVGFITSFEQLFSYKKLTTKLLDILFLIVNGLFIRHYIMPKLNVGAILSKSDTVMFGASAGLSLSAWLNAIFLGKAVVFTSLLDLKGFIILCLLTLATGLIGGTIFSFFITIRIQE